MEEVRFKGPWDGWLLGLAPSVTSAGDLRVAAANATGEMAATAIEVSVEPEVGDEAGLGFRDNCAGVEEGQRFPRCG